MIINRFELTSEQWHATAGSLMAVYAANEEVRSMLRLVRASLLKSEFAEADEIEDANRVLVRSIDTLGDMRIKPLDVLDTFRRNGNAWSLPEAAR